MGHSMQAMACHTVVIRIEHFLFLFLSLPPSLSVVSGQLIFNQLFGNETKPEICIYNQRNKETGGAYLSDLSV